MSELKPCPFCGSEAKTKRDDDGNGLIIYCPTCSKDWNLKEESPGERWASDFYGWGREDDDAVIAAWNRRAIDYPTCTIVSEIFYDDYNEYEIELSCGDSIRWIGTAKDIAFCPICGAKVVK